MSGRPRVDRDPVGRPRTPSHTLGLSSAARDGIGAARAAFCLRPTAVHHARRRAGRGSSVERHRRRRQPQTLARELTGREPDHVVDVVTLGPSLLGWGDDGVKAAVATVAGSDLVVVASPTYKGSITGVLKCFLDQVAAGAWRGVTAVPLMLGGGPTHSLAPEYALVPVLTELGASVPSRGLYLLDSTWEDPASYQPWLDAWGDTVRAASSTRQAVTR